MIKILSRSKLFLDIGFHPGRDRPPREAAALYNLVVVNNHGGCYYHEDCPLPVGFKVDCYARCRGVDVDELANRIVHWVENYYKYISEFEEFREFIRNEPKLYMQSLEKLVSTIT